MFLMAVAMCLKDQEWVNRFYYIYFHNELRYIVVARLNILNELIKSISWMSAKQLRSL